MSKVVDYVESEPVRAYAYSVIVAVLALLVGVGVVTAALVPLIVTLAAVVLAVGGVEKARGAVTPTQNCPGNK